MIVFPNAKINLGLRVIRKRPDGFHDLESAFLPIGLTDALEILPSGNGQESKSNNLIITGLPLDVSDDNLCLKAHRIIQEKHGVQDVSMHLHKKIPSGAGLGGGSSDAAFTLLALDDMFGLDLDKPKLLEYASRLGSDCPFFILNSPSLATGRGEKLKPLSLDLSGYILLLVLPAIPVNTTMAFKLLKLEKMGPTVADILKRPPEDWKDDLVNHFEPPIFNKYPLIGRIKDAMYTSGAIYASMSGSGSAVFGLFREMPHLPAEISRYNLHIERIT